MIPECEKQMDNIEVKKMALCKKKKVLEAITVLKELNKKFMEDEAKKQPLLEEATDSPIFLQVSMKKIPPKKMVKRINVSLPNSMMTDATEVCLFTGDLDKRNKKAEIDPDVLHYKDLLKKQAITKVTEVITLRQLRTEYKVFEARRQLMAAYDVFLSDKKIAQCLPKVLGKAFYKKRKFPIQINMNTPNLKNQVDKALSKTVFAVNCRGNSCISEVARLSMDDDKILENVLSSVKVLADQLPGEQENIFGIYIKTARSTAIPIFISFGNPNEVKIKRIHNHEKVILEELSTLPNAKVKVFSDGKIIVKKPRSSKGEASTKIAKGKRKRTDKKKLIKGNLEVKCETAPLSEESVSVVENIEEDTNESKTKKRKLNVQNRKKLIKGNLEVKCETAPQSEEFVSVVENIEEDTNEIKTKKQNRKRKAQEALGSETLKSKVQNTKDVKKRKTKVMKALK